MSQPMSQFVPRPPGRARLLRRACAWWILLAATLPTARAAVVFSDVFGYPDGPLVTAAGGPWTTYSGTTGQVNVAGGAAVLTGSESEDVTAALSQGFTATATNALFVGVRFRFTALPGASGTYFAHLRSGSSFRGRLFAQTTGAAAGTFRIGVASGTAPATAVFPANLALNEEHLAVLRYGISNAATTLWLNPTSPEDASVTAADAQSAVAISGLSLRQDTGLGTVRIDSITVGTAFTDAAGPPVVVGPQFLLQPQGRVVNPGATLTLTATASGTGPLACQWQREGQPLAGETNLSLTLSNVTEAMAGSYRMTVTNVAGSATSEAAAVTVVPPVVRGPLVVMFYNAAGHAATNWSTNLANVQALGRQIAFIQPDIVALNEIPHTNTWQMTNFVTAFTPGWYLATNSGTDGFERSVVLSRWPIRRSQKWLDGVSLAAFGYSGNFARDLFEAEIQVPGFWEPLHVFVAHLKAFEDTASSAKRAAEASAISNFFVTQFRPAYPSRPYLLAGDLNEDISRPPTNSGGPIQRLVNPATGLHLLTPLNPFTGDERTISIRDNLTVRFDYVLPGPLLASNVLASQVFRSDLLNPTPATLPPADSETASDHLPIVVTFANPYGDLRIRSISLSGPTLQLAWDSRPGRRFTLEQSTGPGPWTLFATNVPAAATGSVTTFSTNAPASVRFLRVRLEP
ncbi:MAG: hypothetical protein RJA22_1791 [Verrucomicrobiota bacterium]